MSFIGHLSRQASAGWVITPMNFRMTVHTISAEQACTGSIPGQSATSFKGTWMKICHVALLA
jgi:hypothetical protein